MTFRLSVRVGCESDDPEVVAAWKRGVGAWMQEVLQAQTDFCFGWDQDAVDYRWNLTERDVVAGFAIRRIERALSFVEGSKILSARVEEKKPKEAGFQVEFDARWRGNFNVFETDARDLVDRLSRVPGQPKAAQEKALAH